MERTRRASLKVVRQKSREGRHRSPTRVQLHQKSSPRPSGIEEINLRPKRTSSKIEVRDRTGLIHGTVSSFRSERTCQATRQLLLRTEPQYSIFTTDVRPYPCTNTIYFDPLVFRWSGLSVMYFFSLILSQPPHPQVPAARAVGSSFGPCPPPTMLATAITPVSLCVLT